MRPSDLIRRLALGLPALVLTGFVASCAPGPRLFVNQQQVRELAHPLAPTDSVQIVQALSGG